MCFGEDEFQGVLRYMWWEGEESRKKKFRVEPNYIGKEKKICTQSVHVMKCISYMNYIYEHMS